MSDADLFTDQPAPMSADLFTDEPAPKSLSDFAGNTISNVGRIINPLNLAKGTAEQVKQGAFDMPLEATNTLANKIAEAVGGEKDESVEKTDLEHLLQDKTMEKRAEETANSEPVQHPIDYAYKNPVDTALTLAAPVLPFLGGKVPRGTVPEAAAAADVAEAAPKGLPIIPPGAKTGEPHALFAYNDKFGPGGTDRSLYNVFGDPEHPAIKSRGWGSSVPAEDLEKAGIPIKGREPNSAKFEPIEKPSVVPIEPQEGPAPEPASRIPPDPNAPPPPKAAAAPVDPLKEIKDYIASKSAQFEKQPGWQEKAAKYVKNEVGDLRAKDIGMRDPMIRSLDPKNPIKALQKAEDLMGYAAQKGYFKPGLTDIARKDQILKTIEKTGEGIGAVRTIGSQRAAAPVAEIRKAIETGLGEEYGTKAASEIKTVLSDFDRMAKKDPSFNGLAKVATYLNGEKSTFNKIGQNSGPTIEAANIIGRLNNEALRKVLTPEENTFYTQNLRDFGAHKALEKMVASAGRRAMTGRGAPGGALAALWQQLWDRGGYRAAGNIADRVSTSVLKNPGRIKSLPDFFEELAHHANEELDDTIAGTGMYKGGRVPDDVKRYVSTRC